jgi:sigma-B regulation protein RsbU (phosphoserine phosphatase)
MIETKTSQSQLQVLLLGSGQDGAFSKWEERLKAEGISCVSLPVTDYALAVAPPSGVGTVIVDMKGLNEGQREALDAIANQLIQCEVPIILLNAGGESAKWRHGVVQELSSPGEDVMTGLVLAHLATRSARAAESERVRLTHGDTTEQLKMAGRVQHDFLPARLPNSDCLRWAAVFRPAEWVSGDMYDVARLDERHIGFYVADAVGHSMPAALLTMFLKHKMAMRETVGNAYRIFEPAEVMSRLNVLMTEQGLSGCQFATVCYCLLNTDTRELRFARAGHPYPVLMRHSGEILTLETRGPLLGVFRDSRYIQGSVTLEMGDKFLLYSDGADGLVGTTSRSGELEFTPRFRAMSGMRIEEMLTELDRAAQEYVWPDGQKDDITALGLEVL